MSHELSLVEDMMKAGWEITYSPLQDHEAFLWRDPTGLSGSEFRSAGLRPPQAVVARDEELARNPPKKVPPERAADALARICAGTFRGEEVQRMRHFLASAVHEARGLQPEDYPEVELTRSGFRVRFVDEEPIDVDLQGIAEGETLDAAVRQAVFRERTRRAVFCELVQRRPREER